ncbi:TRAP transporter small permease [Oceanibacterium hippocampi]|uniref:TRAP transporter small permease protein n=1 Tax=Oceanibacterium hippocampi TaxID=745714 RepID=A0A1Y5TT46_9PROT|nr:TRAP transporter small permease [Oceanibacterium hippocampi]SLN71723.1 Tripartite ATP-independent periplasmic transporters, DctQ component [Oceanibacterium hippocampi]
MRKWFEGTIVRGSGTLGALALILLGLVVTFEVVLRAFGFAIVGGVEISAILLAVLVFAGLSFTQATDGHVTMEAVVNLTPPAYRRASQVLSLLICTGTSGLMTWGTATQAIRSYTTKEFQFGTTHFPLWPTKAVVAIGLGLLTIMFLLQALSAVRAWRSRTDVEGG